MAVGQDPPILRYLSTAELVGGGDNPWQINKALQVGEPDTIANLAEAFSTAGTCTTTTEEQFTAAKLRFETAWNHDQGPHPINDSLAVQQASQQMNLQAPQLNDIAVQLEEIAATLATAQRLAQPLVGGLNAVLMSIDAQIGLAIQARDRQAVDTLRASAKRATADTSQQVTALRDDYSQTLTDRTNRMRVDGYEPDLIKGIDADGHTAQPDLPGQAAKQYDNGAHAADQAMVDSGAGSPQQLADARARLRDFATVTDPASDPASKHYAGERLDDYNTALRQGPFPPGAKDPVLGTDPATRARQRLDLQRQFEQGNPLVNMPGRTPDQVTAMLDDAEEKARVMVTQRAVTTLEHQGMTPEGAMTAVDHLGQGMTWDDIVAQAKYDTSLAGAYGAGAEAYAGAHTAGAHTFERLSESDIQVAEKLGKYVGWAGSAGELLTAGAEVAFGDAPPGETLGGAAGSVLGGWSFGELTVLGVGSLVGPEGTAAAAVLMALAGGAVGSYGGSGVGKWLFDD